MPKRPPPGRCVHCLKHFDELTWDHVLPESWYPDGAVDFEKWDVPACKPCNKRLGKIEESLLTKLGLCLDPKELAALGISDRVLRSLNPLHGKNDRDRAHRQKKRDKVLRETRVFQKLPEQGIFPNFGPLPNLEYSEYPAVMLDQEDIETFAEKIVRGIAFVADGSFIDDGYDIELFVIDEGKAMELKDMVNSGGAVFERGPAFIVKRILVEGDRVRGMYHIQIWGRFSFFVAVSEKGLRERIRGA